MSNGGSFVRQYRSVAAVAVPLVIALVLALLPWLYRRPHPQITVENFRKIKHGMTQQEVESILGGPPGDYASGVQVQYFCMSCEGSTGSLFEDAHGRKAIPPEQIQPFFPNGRITIWRGTECAIGVEFDGNGTVFRMGIGLGWAPPEPPILERIRDWLEF